LEQVFRNDIEPNRVAAIIIEPVQGEGGFYPVPDGFLRSLKEVAERHGIVFICDEIQTGFGRTGRMFCCEHEGVEPDMLTLAKGIAGGFPIAAVVGRRAIMDAPDPGGLGGTYAGSPLGCAAALAALSVIEREGLCQRADDVGRRIRAGLERIQAQFPGSVGDIRGRGAMIAMELVRNGDAGQPDADLTGALVVEALRRGLLLLSCGVRGNVIRILAPLTIPFDHLDEGLGLLAATFEACAG
jgi:4-aminobutyrate aminotransferase/(S)-3-amino-2-methylpropionate transaminase